MTEFNRIVPILRMFDPAKMREFYIDFLGFKIDWEHRFSPDLPLYVQVSRGGIVLHLTEHHGDAAPGAKAMIVMAGLRDYREALLAKKYRFSRPGIERQEWGAITMTIADPFHNYLMFTEYQDETVTT